VRTLPCPRRSLTPFQPDGRKPSHQLMQVRPATCSHHAISSTVKTHAPSVNHYMALSGPSRRARAFSATSDRPPTLPRLPVPDLHQTLSKYLRSLVPLLQEDEARGGSSWRSALQERQRWADEFERGLGAKCQERLHGKSLRKSPFPSALTRTGKLSTEPLPVTGWMIIYGRKRRTTNGACRS